MGRATEHTDIALTAEDALLIEDIYHKASETYGESLEWADATRDDQIEIIGDDITCIAGNSLIAIDEHFDVYPCLYGVGFHQYTMGNLLREDLADIWSSQRWLPFRGGTVLDDLPECRICGLNKTCAIKVCRLRPLFEGNGFYGNYLSVEKIMRKICPPYNKLLNLHHILKTQLYETETYLNYRHVLHTGSSWCPVYHRNCDR